MGTLVRKPFIEHGNHQRPECCKTRTEKKETKWLIN